MKTLLELSREIQKNPEQATDLLTSFRTTSSEIRDFLFSMQSISVYMLPALIQTFAENHREDDPRTLNELINKSWGVGAIFTVSDRDGYNITYTYVGLSSSGKALCRPDSSNLVFEFDLSTEIKNVF